MDSLGGTSQVVEENVLQKLAKAKEFKQKGNEHFKQQQLKKAIQSYHSGLMYMKGIHQDMNPNKLLGQCRSTPSLSQEVKDEVNILSADLHNNIAACLLKQKPVRYERVIECCKQVTELHPDNVKGWYRLGLARYHLRDHDNARGALQEANKITGGQDMAVRKLLVSVDQEIMKENAKFSEMFRNSLLAKET